MTRSIRTVLIILALPALLTIGCSKESDSGVFPRVVTLDVGAGANNPGAATVSVAGVDVAMLQIRLVSGPDEDVRVGSITFTASGTGNDAVDVASVDLWVDADEDGQYSAASDSPLAPGSGYAADDGTVTFSALNRVIPASGAETWLLTYTFSGSASLGDTFSASLVAIG
ncbi:MAG: hypothetical protein ACYS47_14310, partial [Planctomycetota bacterium]